MELQKLLTEEQLLVIKLISIIGTSVIKENTHLHPFDPEEVLGFLERYEEILKERGETPSKLFSKYKENLLNGKQEFIEKTKGNGSITVSVNGHNHEWNIKKHIASDIAMEVKEVLSPFFMYWWNHYGGWIKKEPTVESHGKFLVYIGDVKPDTVMSKNVSYSHLVDEMEFIGTSNTMMNYYKFNYFGMDFYLVIDNDILVLVKPYQFGMVLRHLVFPFGFINSLDIKFRDPVFIPLTLSDDELYSLTR